MTDIHFKSEILSETLKHLHISPAFMSEMEITSGHDHFGSDISHKNIPDKVFGLHT